jgi:hypothetical protein
VDQRQAGNGEGGIDELVAILPIAAGVTRIVESHRRKSTCLRSMRFRWARSRSDERRRMMSAKFT